MKLYPEHKTSLKYYAAIFLIFGIILLLCGTLFENGDIEIADHQETMYRQDQVHYWAGIPFVFLAIISVLFLIFQFNFLLKLCICFDLICVNLAIFVIIVEGPDWKKYAAKSSHYSHSSDIDYLMLKPSAAFGKDQPLSETAYMSAMNYSGAWVIIAILSILLGIETLLTHIKVYCGIESIYGYLTGYELIYPEIILKMAQPVEKFQCKGCQTRVPTPNKGTDHPDVSCNEKSDLRSPPDIAVEPPTCGSEDPVPRPPLSPTLSVASNTSNAFYVCHEGDGIKLVGYKPRRHAKHGHQLCTHDEEEELPPEHYHFSRKHPNEVEDPNSSMSLPHSPNHHLSPNRPHPPTDLPVKHRSSGSNTPSPSNLPLAKDPKSYRSPMSPSQSNPFIQHPQNIPTPPPLPPTNFKQSNSRHSSPSIPSPPLLPPLDFHSAASRTNERRNLSPIIHKPTAFSPVQPKNQINRSPVDRSPGKYPPVGDIFPPPPSTLPSHSKEKGRVSFVDPGNKPVPNPSSSSGQKRNSKLETLF
ncbi:uncharacterized protein LOC114525519 isoform X1 [Dendronephthya gigantea]|uniref:uncharacterized protein LOC114525519 isoform X1 n=1 Tax=Dendronephthya gigantea TaxID=151771 RepID=UPI00106B30E2|nr:uncharacterized protein LOC114525519 isoform X1 [Dendronephthya gigantea]